MRMILVPVADRPECAYALNTALGLGKVLGASITGCHILAHRDSSNLLSSEFSAEYFTGQSTDAAQAWLSRSSITSSVAAQKMFNQVAEDNGYIVRKRIAMSSGAIWQEKYGSPDKVLRIIGPVNDLTVVTRPITSGSGIARLFMLSAIMESGRPVLILPHTGADSVGKRILIAWNQSMEAARAVASCLPLLKQAETVTITSSGKENRAGPKSQQLKQYLTSWGVNASIIKTAGKNTERELINTYRHTNSDVLLMGAYSRRRWRELLFGGTSQYMLEKASIPVLMLHT